MLFAKSTVEVRTTAKGRMSATRAGRCIAVKMQTASTRCAGLATTNTRTTKPSGSSPENKQEKTNNERQAETKRKKAALPPEIPLRKKMGVGFGWTAVCKAIQGVVNDIAKGEV